MNNERNERNERDDDSPGDSPGDTDAPRRIRLHPRRGSEHRYRFARRWESRRRSRTGLGMWRIIFLDGFVVVLLYLLGRQILQRIAG